MNYKNKPSNLSGGIKPFQVKSKSDIKKYCFDHKIPAPRFSAKLEKIFVDGNKLNYHNEQDLLEMASRIGYSCSFVTGVTSKS